MKQLGLPTLTGLAHGASDAVAGFLVVQVLMLNSQPIVDYVLIYNVLAFGLQPVAGLLLDQFKFQRRGASVGLLLSALALILTWVSLTWGILFAGLGSAIFHTGGGSTALTSTPGRATGPGIFAAFGVVGLAIGSQLAFYFSATTITAFTIILLLLAAVIWFFPASSVISSSPDSISTSVNIELLVFGLVLAIALRSYVWAGLQSGQAGYSQLAFSVALAAGLGKLIGGFLADKFGWRTYAIIALVASAFLLAFGGAALWPLLMGIFFLQSVTPLSLAAVGYLMPSSPALATGLVLGVGVLLGGLLLVLLGSSWLANPLGIIWILFASSGLYLFTLLSVGKLRDI